MINYTPIHELVHIGSFHVYSWGFMLVLGFIIAGLLFFRQANKKRLSHEYILNVLLMLLLGTIIGGRLFYVLEHFSYYSSHLLDILAFGQGGETSYGGILLGLVFLWLYNKFSKYKGKLSFSELLDLIAPYVVLGACISRIGCFLNWDDFGIQSTLPWAIQTIGDVARHPTQLYESFYLLIIFSVLLVFRKIKENPSGEQTRFKMLLEKKGSLFLIFVLFYSFLRFFNDFLRVYDNYFLGLALSQWICIALFISGIFILWKKK
jgi:phosphatidylglycerol:prolipoprotein diacylglycerol transferase